MSQPNRLVNFPKSTVNILREGVAQAVSGAPAKVIALQLGCSDKQVKNLRSGLLLPHVPLFLEIARRNPALKAKVLAILSGDGEVCSAETINQIIRGSA